MAAPAALVNGTGSIVEIAEAGIGHFVDEALGPVAGVLEGRATALSRPRRQRLRFVAELDVDNLGAGEQAEDGGNHGIGQRVFEALAPVLIGPLGRYAGIRAETVADAIVALIGREEAGRFVHENDQLTALAR